MRARGLDEALRDAFANGTPILGICLGAQIVLEFTEEGRRDCLGLIEGDVSSGSTFPTEPSRCRISAGTTSISARPHPLLKGIRTGDEFYFVHSYFAVPTHTENVYGTTEYGIRFCSILGKENLFATQFHLEKSGRMGLAILDEFQRWDGRPC
ncbi:MAG: imidazole glycerol phosphate synthase subunit HisH [Gammaproteobacteria bacterium]|nr:imidazole glycerol phosphate synthase subunit HisH [Gammaproteobacteria bacterium]